MSFYGDPDYTPADKARDLHLYQMKIKDLYFRVYLNGPCNNHEVQVKHLFETGQITVEEEWAKELKSMEILGMTGKYISDNKQELPFK